MELYRKNKAKVIFATRIVLLVIILLVGLIGIQKQHSLVNYNDEFGYWTAAAFFTGKDWWAHMASQIQYYSFGYGLILAPVLLLAPNSIVAYQMAVVVNLIMLLVSFVVMEKIIRSICNNLSDLQILLICFFATCYPAYIIYAHYTLCETYLYLIFLLLLYNFISFTKNMSYLKLEIVLILTGVCYSIHQRTLGILISGIIILALLILKSGKSKKQKMSFLLLLVINLIVIFGLIAIVKDLLIDVMYSNSEILQYTDYSGQASKVMKLFTLEGIYCFINNIIGRVWYSSVSTFGIFFVGLISLVKNIFVLLKKLINKKKISIFEWVLSYVGLAYFLSVAISALAMITPNRVDHMIYGRYTEYYTSIICVLGIVILIKEHNWLKCFLQYAVFVLLASVATEGYILNTLATSEVVENWISNVVSIGVLPYLPEQLVYEQGLGYLIARINVVVAFLLFYLVSLKDNDGLRKKCQLATIVLISIFYCFSMSKSLELTVYADQGSKKENTLKVAQYIEDLDETPTIYYFYGNQYMESIQFYYPDIEMNRINIEAALRNTELIPQDAFIIDKKASGYGSVLDERYEKVLETSVLEVFVRKDSVFAINGQNQ